MKKAEWVCSKRTWIRAQPTLPGVWECKDGGFLIRGETVNPLTGKPKEVRRVLRDARNEFEAKRILDDELDRIRAGGTLAQSTTAKPTFAKYIALYLERRTSLGKIKSAATKELWAGFIKNWFMPAPWFKYLVDKTETAHIQEWLDTTVTPKVRAGTWSPVTANTMLRKLRQVWRKCAVEHKLGASPMAGIDDYDTSTVRTYTDAQPNSLTDEEMPAFLAKCRQMYRRHYCQVFLGFVTGQRPSSLRPLRRKGPEPDVLWDKKAIVIRRSHSRGQEVMEKAKTRKSHDEPDLIVYLPDAAWAVIEEHVNSYESDAQIESDLLFPSLDGKIQNRSALQKPFETICKALKLTKKITPRAMRRTSGDLLRIAGIDKKVRKAVSGHKTDEMKELYETVAAKEMRESIEKAMMLATGTGAPPAPTPPPVGGPYLRRIK